MSERLTSRFCDLVSGWDEATTYLFMFMATNMSGHTIVFKSKYNNYEEIPEDEKAQLLKGEQICSLPMTYFEASFKDICEATEAFKNVILKGVEKTIDIKDIPVNRELHIEEINKVLEYFKE